MLPFKPVVRNVNTKDIYFYNGNNEFTNIRTNVTGKVSDAAAQKTFKINPELSIMLNEYPLIAELINKTQMMIEK